MPKTLILLRHAKSSWTVDAPDKERPLSSRGRRDGTAAGRTLAARNLHPDLVLCSSAVRTQQTLERVLQGGAKLGRLSYSEALYQADGQQVIDIIKATAESVRSLLVLGHNPSMEDATRRLAEHRGTPDLWQRMDEKFPTSAFAVLSFDGTWAGIESRPVTLIGFEIPRGRN